MPRAFTLIRKQPHYRSEAFAAGLARAGYQVIPSPPYYPVTARDVLVIWNRYGEYHRIATEFERRGGLVLVAENGYLGHDANGIQYYALAAHGHNGSGVWPRGDASRWQALGIDVHPWRARADGHLYIRGQRGIGSPDMASPPAWHRQVAAALEKAGRKVMVDDHPGKPACDPGVTDRVLRALAGAQACAVWSSGVGVRALVDGVPVYYDAPHWICEGAAVQFVLGGRPAKMDDAARLDALHAMAWAQWNVVEIASGEPFKFIVEAAAAAATSQVAA